MNSRRVSLRSPLDASVFTINFIFRYAKNLVNPNHAFNIPGCRMTLMTRFDINNLPQRQTSA